MFYILNFTTHSFSAHETVLSVNTEISNLLKREQVPAASIEIIDGSNPDNRYGVVEFLQAF